MIIKEFVISKSENGLKNHINDCAEILKTSIHLVENENKTVFLKVIATQLRMLLCDGDNSLLKKFSNLPKLSALSDYYLIDEIDLKSRDPRNLFDLNSERYSIDEWINQVLIFYNMNFEFPREIICPKCKQSHLTENYHTDMELYVNKRNILRYTCTNCNKKRSFDFTNLNRKTDNWIELPLPLSFTINDLIKNYSEKNGGAHVDKNLGLISFGSIFMGENYLKSIAIYMIEYISTNFSDSV